MPVAKQFTRKKMIKIGRINKLVIKKTMHNGVYLDGGDAGDILLSKKQMPKWARLGDEVEVFVYADKEGRLRATSEKPYATVGQFAFLQVVAQSASGVYLDWGMQKDLFVPKREQRSRMIIGKSYVVYVFLDKKTNRVAASSKLENYLGLTYPDYEEGDEVDLLLYDTTDLGFKVIVNNAHEGMIYKNEVFRKLFVGRRIKGYVKKVRDDLKVDVSIQQSGYQGVVDMSQVILNIIKDHGGKIAVTDKSPPEEIYALFGVSKKVFKKAIGGLYKKRLITLDSKGIRLTGR